MDDGANLRYNDIIMDHFKAPRNVGELDDPDGIGTLGDPSCGDSVLVTIKISEDFHLSDIKFKCTGCPAAIAVCSIMTEMAMGMHIDEASESITDEAVDKAAGGLPPTKKHCSNLAAAALYKAIVHYTFK